MRNKTKSVLEYLQTGRGISSMEAFEMFYATRLSAIIFNLRKCGYNIISNWVEEGNRFDNEVRESRFVRYYLIENNLEG